MSVTSLQQHVETIINASGKSHYAAWLLAAARSGYDLAPRPSTTGVEQKYVQSAYQALVAACRIGCQAPARPKHAIRKTPRVHISAQAVKDYLSSKIDEIEREAPYQNTTNNYILNLTGNSTHPFMEEEFKQVLLSVFTAGFWQAKKIEEKEKNTTTTGFPWIAGISQEVFWSAVVASTSAISSYVFAAQYYHENGLGLEFTQRQPLRHIIAQTGGMVSLGVFYTLLYFFDLRRIKTIVMQYSISEVKTSLLRKLKSLICIEKSHVFQRSYPALLVRFFAVANFLTTFNSPYLSYVHISIPILREISMIGAFLSALLGNNYVIEAAYAKPLNNLYYRKLRLRGYAPDSPAVILAEQAKRGQKRLDNLLKAAKKDIKHALPEQLYHCLKVNGNEVITYDTLLHYFMTLGTQSEALKSKNITSTSAPTEKMNNTLAIAGHTAVLFGSFYALSTCIRQGQDAVKLLLGWLCPALDPTLVFILGYFAGIPSILANMIVGYYAVIYVFKLIKNMDLSPEQNDNWLKQVIKASLLILVAIANTIPSYQISVDHPQWTGASVALAFVAFCMSIFSIKSFFSDQHHAKFDLMKALSKVQSEEELSQKKLTRLKSVLLEEIGKARDIIANTDDEMIAFYTREVGLDDSVDAPLCLAP
jgi:hypothetical protein